MNEAETRATYAWALLNGCCDDETQAEFDNLALVPKEAPDTVRERSNRSLNHGTN